MIPAPIPADEASRLRELRSYGILDSAPEPEFDDIARLASLVCDTPIAAISLIDAERQWFKARVGALPSETPRDVAFCAHAILDVPILQVPDATLDPRFADNPLVTHGLAIRFYAGFPLVDRSGAALGTLCVIDQSPRALSPAQLEALQALGRVAVTQLEVRRTLLRNREHLLAAGRNEQRLAQSVSAGGIGVWEMDPASGTVVVAGLFARLIGVPSDEAPRPSALLYEAVHADDRRAFTDELRRAVDARRRFESEVRVVWPDGTLRWLHFIGGALYDDDGEAYRVSGTARDITDRRRDRHESARRIERLELAAEASRTGVWEWVAPEPVPYVSTVCKRLLGLRPDDAVPSFASLFDRVLPEDRSIVQDAVEHCRGDAGCGESSMEARVRLPDGSLRQLKVVGRITRNADGQPVRMVGAMTDVTEARDRERALANARTSADHASAAKSAFLANVSHEIRTPLHGILGLTRLLAESRLDAEQREFVDGVDSSAQSLLRLVNDLLDVSAVEAGRMTLAVAPFALVDVVHRVRQQLAPVATAKGLELAVVVDPKVDRRFSGDAGRLLQVLINLVGNAVKFTERGSVRLTVAAPSATDDGLRLRFEVADTGAGLPAASIPRLFKPFSRLDDGQATPGTGLGLAICRSLVVLMGGDIGVQPNVPAGSVFWLEVPLPTTDAELPARATAEPARPLPASRVLVVEDNEINEKILCARLRRWGLTVSAARNGVEALAALQREPFDLVLMDGQMPVMDGYEATRQLRRSPDPAVAAVPIVAMTADALPGDRERCIAAGMNDYVSKPVDDALLHRVLTQWLPAVPRSASAPGVDPAVLDRHALQRMTGVDPSEPSALLSELVGLFRSGTPALVRSITEGSRAEDWRRVRAAVHTLKSNASYLGAVALLEGCRTLEAALQAFPVDEALVVQRADAVERAHVAFLDALTQAYPQAAT